MLFFFSIIQLQLKVLCKLQVRYRIYSLNLCALHSQTVTIIICITWRICFTRLSKNNHN